MMKSKLSESFGRRLKSAREQNNKSQLDLAIDMRGSCKEIRGYEDGSKPLNVINYVKVCRQLSINPFKTIVLSIVDWILK